MIVDFDIPEEIGGVKRWFMDTLWSLARVTFREKPGVELVLERPRAKRLDDPDADIIVTEIVVAAHRMKTVPVPSSWSPQFVIERFDTEELDLGTVFVFRLCALPGETYVWASCEERPAALWKIFVDFLRRVEARYPEVGRFWEHQATQHRERLKEDLRTKLGGPGTRPDGGAEVAVGDTQRQRPEESATRRRGDAAAPPRRRGRKPTDPSELNKICADWYKVQHRETQTDFCNRKGISPSQLRRWLKGYRYPDS